ncbi:MAG: hypothetical protein ACPGXL_02120 [Chitinophagales bacterium]
MKRRNFLAASSLTVISLSTFGHVTENEKGQFKGSCVTTNDILGPFYRPQAPIRTDLTYEGIEGAVITLTGKVFQEDCVSPLKNALVEVWHCSVDGEYDNDTPEFRHRARQYTDETGVYSFKTILPGKYLNGRLYRPAHIHYRVTEKYSKELVSQLYFQGDPHIEEDPWASTARAERRICSIAPADLNGGLQVSFDIYMADQL